jgi:acyl-CoA synthetase (AMP-forming)/AMP-acid ligase II
MRLPASRLTAASVVDLLRTRAAQAPDHLAYLFLEDGEDRESRVSYAELDRRARAIAVELCGRVQPGSRVLLLYPPGIDYIAGFFGCLYAGMIAVPAYPPDPRRLPKSLPRLQAMVRDSGATLALTTRELNALSDSLLREVPDLAGMRWSCVETPEGAEAGWRAPAIDGDTIAFLQYTSGSTGAPKGVMLSHGNLLHNSEVIRRGFDYANDPVAVVWLPPYHDMGLIGGVLQPLYNGFPAVSMSPLSFLQHPFRWLRAITRHRGTACGAPGFAYDLCARKSTPEERAALDLSSWEIAFCGAEPIRSETLERFAQTFASCGFRREAFYPCYGLAEATLMVSGGLRAVAPVLREGEPGKPPLVGCGSQTFDQRVVIVDAQAGAPVADGQIGEVWVAGPSVGRGYWNRPDDSERIFGAFLADGAGPFLRTGDLGFLHDGELFITGRAKDVLILRGRNLYPHDLERSVEELEGSLRHSSSAAFLIDRGAGDELVFAGEVDPRRAVRALDQVAMRVRQTLAEEHGVQARIVVLLRPGAMPKTSSGKVQRFACKAAFLDRTLDPALVHELGIKEAG